MKLLGILMAIMTAVVLSGAVAQAQPDCVPYCTYTPGGWGAPCQGGNAGCLRDTYFDTVFPGGLVMGGGYIVTFTSAQAVQNFYPEGGQPAPLAHSYTNPTSTEAGIFGGQVLSLMLNVYFSQAGVGGLVDISGLIIATGPFAGYTVSQLLALANTVLGGDLGALPPGTFIGDLNTAVSSVNSEFDNCTDGTGFIQDIPVVILRDHEQSLPVSLCHTFGDVRCVNLAWWCQYCNPFDFAIFTWVPGCNSEFSNCSEDCAPNPGTIAFSDQHIDSTTADGCWWSVVVSATDPGCICLTFDFQLSANLIGFTATAGSGQVRLDWSTASETENARFEIQRSADNVNWSGIGSVAGHGTVTSTSTYNFTDHSVLNNTTYRYRLLTVSTNGSERQVGGTVMATPSENSGIPASYALYANYPNPFNPTTSIAFDLAQDGFVSLKVYNMVGQEVASLVSGSLRAGHHAISFDASHLPSALYLYKLDVNGYSATRKMLLIK